ncbi:MAG: hypothetical protein KJ726_05390, partial [Verrucomicrobia bacterium]|nr:hypothetical protein [Verrucomicrobiota bacterium]
MVEPLLMDALNGAVPHLIDPPIDITGTYPTVEHPEQSTAKTGGYLALASTPSTGREPFGAIALHGATPLTQDLRGHAKGGRQRAFPNVR